MTKTEFQKVINAFAEKHKNHSIYYIYLEDVYIALNMRDGVSGCFPQPCIYYDTKRRCAVEPDRSLYKSKDLIFRTGDELQAALESYVRL